VLGIQGRQVFLADAAVVDLNSNSAEMTNAVLFLKARPPNPDAPRAGPNSLIVHAKSGRQLENGNYLAEKVTLTPCDCIGEPDYELIADTAEIDEDRAHLRGVDLRLLGAKLPLFPLSLPLTNRQSGLLGPQFGFGAPVGFAYAQPIFLTMGPSADVTIAPGIFTGGHAHGQDPGDRSIKGPRLNLEGRYAPWTGTAGFLALETFYDLDQHDSSTGRGYGGVRGVARLGHRTESGANTFAIQGIAASDVMVLRDQSAASIENTYDLFTSDVGFWRARGPVTVGADATLIQDMRVIAPPDRKLLSGEAAGATMQRLPALFTQVAPIPFGPATFSLEASGVQFARFGHPTDVEVRTGFGPTDHGTPVLDPLGFDGSRPNALRFDLSPRLTLSGGSRLPVDLRLMAGGRIDAWVMEGSSVNDRARAYALLGGRAALPLERQYGSALHRIEPAVEIRALSKQLAAGGPPIGDLTDGGGASFSSAPDAAQQGLPPCNPATAQCPGGAVAGVPAVRRPYDEIDFAAPVTGAVEATASVSQSLWTRVGRTPVRLLRFDLLQDALFWADGAKARLGEGSAVATVQLGPAAISGAVRYDWALHDVSAYSAGLVVRDARGDDLHTSLNMLRGSSSERLRAGIDELFSAARFAATPTALTGGANAGVGLPLPHNLRLNYDVNYTPGDVPATFANWVHVAVVSLDTPCRCAGLRLTVSAPFHDGHLLRTPDFSLLIDLKSLGSFATF